MADQPSRPERKNARLVLSFPPSEKRSLEVEAFERRISVSALVLEERLALASLKKALLEECERRGITLRQLVLEAFTNRAQFWRH